MKYYDHRCRKKKEGYIVFERCTNNIKIKRKYLLKYGLKSIKMVKI